MPAIAEIVKRNKTQRAKLVADSRALIDKAESEKRELGADDQDKLNQMAAEIEAIDGRVSTLEKQMCMEDEGDDEREDDDKGKEKPCDDGERSKPDVVILPDGRRAVVESKGEKRDRRKKPEKRGRHESQEQYDARQRRSTPEYAEAFCAFLEGRNGEREFNRYCESRAVVASIDVKGGFMVPPEQFTNQIIKSADNYLFLRQLATTFKVTDGVTLGAPVLDADPNDADWTSELATGNEDDNTRFGKRELKPNPIARRLKVSNQLMRMGNIGSTWSINDESQGGTGTGPAKLITGRLGYKFAVTQEKAMMTGNGVNQPLGLFTASNRGISTARDVQTGSTTNYTFDGLIQAKYSLKQPYHTSALRWLLPRGGVQRILQLKDNYGQYLWQPSVQAGTPDKLLDVPVLMSEYCPTTFTTGSYVGLLGDFSYLWIAESLNYGVQVLNELYAEQNLTGFIARQEFDAMPVLEEAFVRLITN